MMTVLVARMEADGPAAIIGISDTATAVDVSSEAVQAALFRKADAHSRFVKEALVEGNMVFEDGRCVYTYQHSMNNDNKAPIKTINIFAYFRVCPSVNLRPDGSSRRKDSAKRQTSPLKC